MLLSQLVGAILHDLTTAQDYANEYSSELSKKYKKYEDTDENDLSNYPVPVGRVQEIELDLKFAIESLEKTKEIDIDKTHRSCDRLSRLSVDAAIKEFEKVITEELKVALEPPVTAAPESEKLPVLPNQSQQSEITSQDHRKENREWWQSTLQKLKTREFARYLEKKVAQGLYDYVNDQYYENDDSNDGNLEQVEEVIAQEILDGYLEHQDLKLLIKKTEELHGWKPGLIESRIENLSKSVVKKNIKDKDILNLLLRNDELHTSIIVTPSVLKELQGGLVCSMKIKAELDNYRWMITKTSQSLEKVQE